MLFSECSTRDIRRYLGYCSQCDKRFLFVLILFILVNTYYFVLLSFYFSATPSPFAYENSAHVPRHQFLRKSPYSHPTGALSTTSSLPSHEERQHDISEANLPSFSYDRSEFVLSAIIEQQQLPNDKNGDSHQLSITVFALNRMLLSHGRSSWGPNRLSKEETEQWHTAEEKSRRIYYLANGTRDRWSNIYCQMMNGEGEVLYTSPGRFIPNDLSRDESFNSKIDIFRCAMQRPDGGFSHLIQSNQSVGVHLLRRKREGRTSSLLNFSVPWSARRTGYMQTQNGIPSSASASLRSSVAQYLSPARDIIPSSKWDPWKNYLAKYSDENSNITPTPTLVRDAVYLCVSGMSSSPVLEDMARLLEWVQHHVLLGVTHIFLSVRFAWGSENMKTTLLTLRHFIIRGLVTISSQSGDGHDRTASTKGMAWGDDFLHLYHCTMTLYLGKGTSSPGQESFVGMWSVDEFLIPKHSYNSMQSLIGKQLDDDSPVPCYYLFRSRGLKLKRASEDQDQWIGVKFSAPFHFLDLANHSFLGTFNLLLPVDLSFQLGVPREAVCQAQQVEGDSSSFLSALERLEYDEDNDRFVYNSEGRDDNEHSRSARRSVNYYENSKRGSFRTASTVLYKFFPEGYSAHERQLYNYSKVKLKNRYVTDYAQRVLDSLKAVNLDLIVTLNLPKEPSREGTAVEHWPKFRSASDESSYIF